MIADDAAFTVAARRQRTPVITELLLRPAGPPLRYQPGQYVLLGDPDAELVVRSYSIANAPRRDGLISLLVTRVPGGQLSGWVHDALRPASGCCWPPWPHLSRYRSCCWSSGPTPASSWTGAGWLPGTPAGR